MKVSLFKSKIKQMDKCTVFREAIDDIEHIFCTCLKISDLLIKHGHQHHLTCQNIL